MNRSRDSERRLKKELDEIEGNPSDKFIIQKTSDDLSRWEVLVYGPSETPYEGGRFKLIVNIPLDYPFKPPKVLFETKIYSFLVTENGKICDHCFSHVNTWSPAYRIRRIITDKVMEIMTGPEKYFENVLRPDLADLYRRNKEQYIFNAKEWTRLYADDPGTAES